MIISAILKIYANPWLVTWAAYTIYFDNLGITVTYSEKVDLTGFDWIIIQKRELELVKSYNLESTKETIALLEHLAFGDSVGYEKIYESDNIVVVKPT